MGDIAGTIEMNDIQIRKVESRKERERRFDAAWADKQAATNQALLLFEQERDEKRRADNVRIREENQRAAEAVGKKRSVGKEEEVAFHKDFFDQFNRGSR
jgi:hypothetical protein